LYGGTLFPVLGLLSVYGMIYSYVADHWQYVALVAPVALAVALGVKGGERWLPAGAGRLVVAAAVTLLACGYSAAPALMGGAVAAVAERAPWRGADNVLVPLAVGGALSRLGLR
jgi:tetrahydromethanopterin S-methyltransferase subunit D